MTETVETLHLAPAVAAPAPLLSVITSRWYDDVIRAARLSLEVPQAIVVLLGANGAGKSTTLKAISGLL